MYRNQMKYFSNKDIWKTVCTNQFILESGWTCCSLFVYWSEWCVFYLTVFIQWKTFIFWNVITKKSRSSKFWQKGYQDSVLVSFTATTPNITPTIHTERGGYFLHCQVIGKSLLQNYVHYLVFLTRKYVMLEWNGGHQKLKIIFNFSHLQNVVKYYQNQWYCQLSTLEVDNISSTCNSISYFKLLHYS